MDVDVPEQVAGERDEPDDEALLVRHPQLGRLGQLPEESAILLTRVEAGEVDEHIVTRVREDLVQAVEIRVGRQAEPHRRVI